MPTELSLIFFCQAMYPTAVIVIVHTKRSFPTGHLTSLFDRAKLGVGTTGEAESPIPDAFRSSGVSGQNARDS